MYANLGREEDVDAELARELVSAIERCTRAPSASNSGLSDWMQGLNKVLRPIEPLLRDLVSRGGALARGLPAGPERESRIESVLRDCLVSAETAGNRLPVLAAKQLES